MNILAFKGSARDGSNSSTLLNAFVRGTVSKGGQVEIVDTVGLDLKFCTGCLRCNMVKRCALRGDGWPDLSEKIMAADALVFATPVFFHSMSGPMKRLLDRFRSFLHVKITEDGLIHRPWREWSKDIVLLATQGSYSLEDSEPLKKLFSFLTRQLGEGNRLHCIIGRRLAVRGQIAMNAAELSGLYGKLGLPGSLVSNDIKYNDDLLKESFQLGSRIVLSRGGLSI